VVQEVEAASFLFFDPGEHAQAFAFKALGFSVLANHERSDRRTLRRAGELHQKCAVVPVLQRGGKFCRATLHFQSVAVLHDFARAVILVFVNSEE
jgi:hypothetical protein